MKLIFWLNIISPHLAPFIRALAEDANWEITVVVEQAMSSERTAQGWTLPALGRASAVVAQGGTIQRVINESGADAVHVLGGMRGCRLIIEVLPLLEERHLRFGIISEVPNTNGIAGIARRLIYMAAAARYSRSLDFVFAIGESGPSWYRSCGFRPDIIWPFIYVTKVERGEGLKEQSLPEDGDVRLSYVGQLIHRKGVDLLLRALSKVPCRSWQLTIIGAGELRSSLEALAAHLSLSSRVLFAGAMPNENAIEILAESDVLVLPSRYDGWGAVANEALMCGVPVICSDRCGVRSLVGASWRGGVYPAGSIASLCKSLTTWIAKGKRSNAERARIRKWSACIEGESVAKYFACVLEHVYCASERPNPKWET